MSKNVRLGKEYIINTNSNNFKSRYGVLNKKSPNVVYVKINSWVEYTGEFKDYDLNINKLNSSIRYEFKRVLQKSNLFEYVFIYTPNIKKNITQNNNRFHASFEFTIKQKEPMTFGINSLNSEIKIMVNNIIKKIENFDLFIYKSTKS